MTEIPTVMAAGLTRRIFRSHVSGLQLIGWVKVPLYADHFTRAKIMDMSNEAMYGFIVLSIISWFAIMILVYHYV